MKTGQRERPLEARVELKSGRTVVVRELNWKAYKQCKAAVLRIVTEKLSPDAIVDIAAVMKSDDPFVTGVQALRSVGVLISDSIDEITPLLVAGCIDPDQAIDVEALGPMDMLKLREACGSVNDLDQLIGLEGNALAAAVNRINALMAVGGGSGSKQPSPNPTSGVSLT